MVADAPTETPPASSLDLAGFRATPLESDPFDHIVLRDFVPPAVLAEVNRDFPAIVSGGSYTFDGLEAGPAFRRLAEELQGPAVRAAFEEKFGLDLTGRPTTLTVRGHSRHKDGRIHTDSKTKLITVLVYLNPSWDGEGGRLRLLRDGKDLEDYAAEVEPAHGTLVAFRNGPTAFHGHHRFVGERRSLQLNWVVDESALQNSKRRHGWSAWLKRLVGRHNS